MSSLRDSCDRTTDAADTKRCLSACRCDRVERQATEAVARSDRGLRLAGTGHPTFDEVSFGFPRLIAAGFLEVDSDAEKTVVRASPKARELRSTITAKTLGGVLGETAAAVGAAPYPEAETEDRSQGRLPGLDAAEWEAEVRAYHASWGTGLTKFFAAGGAAIAGVAVAVIVRGRRGPRG